MSNIIPFKVLTKAWRLRILDKKTYAKKHGTDSLAITHVQKRRIDLSPKGLDKDTIIHELVHAYLAELCVHSCDLDDDNLEEIFAELMSRRGAELLRLADRLKTALNKRKVA